MSQIWLDSPSSVHRRASTQPSKQTLMWEALRAAQLATPNDLNGMNTDELMEKFKNEQDTLGELRRVSVATSTVNRFVNKY
jgi:hypothetical protein